MRQSSSSKISFWAGKGLAQTLLCSPVLSFPRQTQHLPPGWAPLSPCKAPRAAAPQSHSPSLGKQRCASPDRLRSSSLHLHSALPLARQSCRAFSCTPPERQRALIGSFVVFSLTRAGHVVHSRWIQQLHWLVSARKPIWKEGRGEENKITSTLGVAELFLAIASRKRYKSVTNYRCRAETQVAQINGNENIPRTAKAENQGDSIPHYAQVFLVFKSTTGADPNLRKLAFQLTNLTREQLN